MGASDTRVRKMSLEIVPDRRRDRHRLEGRPSVGRAESAAGEVVLGVGDHLDLAGLLLDRNLALEVPDAVALTVDGRRRVDYDAVQVRVPRGVVHAFAHQDRPGGYAQEDGHVLGLKPEFFAKGGQLQGLISQESWWFVAVGVVAGAIVVTASLALLLLPSKS